LASGEIGCTTYLLGNLEQQILEKIEAVLEFFHPSGDIG